MVFCLVKFFTADTVHADVRVGSNILYKEEENDDQISNNLLTSPMEPLTVPFGRTEVQSGVSTRLTWNSSFLAMASTTSTIIPPRMTPFDLS